MSETKFTPGPWMVGPYGGVYPEAGGAMVLSANTKSGPLTNSSANERLAAAAPELYAALKEAEQCEAALILQWSDFWEVAPPVLIESLIKAQSLRTAALAKAEGKATT